MRLRQWRRRPSPASDRGMSNCAICQAPLPRGASACPYAVPESVAPWRGAYAAMHRDDMTHTQHKTHVARWALHNVSSQAEGPWAMYRLVAAAQAGQQIAFFQVGEPGA